MACVRWLFSLLLAASIAIPQTGGSSVAGTSSEVAQDRDLYPQIHTLMQEADAASIHISAFDDRGVPAEWAGHLYARAGYLRDAARAFSRTTAFPINLLKADVLYGESASADKLLARISDPYKKGQAMLVVADVVWRMGQSPKAKEYVERAKRAASAIQDQPQRTRLLELAKEDTQYFNDVPPNSLSATPTPPLSQNTRRSVIPQFPITADGFSDQTSRQPETRANSDGALMEELYTRLRANDREGLEHIQEKAATPFQKTLVIASIEHLLIQAQQPAAAEQAAEAIPESDDECVLAKAEALSSVAAEWLRSDRSDRANSAFAKATNLTQSARSLPLGQVSVLTSIGEAEASGGLAATSQETLKIGEEIASQLPTLPTIALRKKRGSSSAHYRPEAYRRIFSVALGAHDLASAQRIAKFWSEAGPNGAGEVMRAWLDAGQPDEAIAVAHGIHNTPQRAKMELWLAQEMLDQAGAPNI